MTGTERYAAAADRNRVLARLRGWTVTCAVAAAGPVGLFSIVAASSFPGNSGTSSSNPGTTNSTSGSQDNNGGGDQSQPAGGIFGSSQGPAQAVSGGS